eukprot:10291443-Lingulodinium_polyedra.AAC.1
MPGRTRPSELSAGTGRAACAHLDCGGTGDEPNSTSMKQGWHCGLTDSGRQAHNMETQGPEPSRCGGVQRESGWR